MRSLGTTVLLSCLMSLAGATEVSAQELKAVDCKFSKQKIFRSRDEYITYQLHQTADEYKYADLNCDGKITPAEHALYEQMIRERIALNIHDYDRITRNGGTIKVPTLTPTASPQAPAAGWRAYPILRDSFSDISVFSKPKDVKLASGAQLTWTNDAIASNSVWSAKGVAAYPIVWTNPNNPAPRGPFDPYLVGFALTPAVNFQRVSNSNAAKQSANVDVLNYTGGAEFGIGHLFDPTTTHYFRVRGGDLTTFEGDTKNWSVTGEWQPITNWVNPNLPNIGSPNSLGALPITYQLDTILRVQYLKEVGDTGYPIFHFDDHITEAGIVLALSMAPQQGPESPVPPWLQRLTLNATYGHFDLVNENRAIDHFVTSAGYSLNEAGNVGLKLSYERGRKEDTGIPVQLTMVGLTAKF